MALSGKSLSFSTAPRNPYQEPYATKALVQLHQHTIASDGADTAAQAVTKYVAQGYDAMAITDHDVYTPIPAGIVGIRGCELSTVTHLTSWGCEVASGGANQATIDAVNTAGGLAEITHPNLSGEASYATLIALRNFVGIDVYNTVTVTIASSKGFAVDVWDNMLRDVGPRVWGFAVDDKHDAIHLYDMGRVFVWVPRITEADIIWSLRNGHFVADACNYGVTLNRPVMSKQEITLTCAGATSIRAIGTGGALLQETVGTSITYSFVHDGSDRWVRLEVVGDYTEPFDTIDTILRYASWGAGGVWVADGVLHQTANNATAHAQHLYRDIHGDMTLTCDVRCVNTANADREVTIGFFAMDDDNCYLLKLTPNDGNFTLYKDVAGVLTSLGSASKSIVSSTWYTVKVQYTLLSNTIQARVWEKASSEPGTWDINLADTTRDEGGFSLRCIREADFDNLYIRGFKSFYQPIIG